MTPQQALCAFEHLVRAGKPLRRSEQVSLVALALAEARASPSTLPRLAALAAMAVISAAAALAQA